MRNRNAIFLMFVLTLFIVACENKSRQTGPIVYDNQSVVQQSTPDTTFSVQEETPITAPVSSSSSQSHQTDDYDNMRGFDPASEDDMDDNGMNRYMENNDDEGWD